MPMAIITRLAMLFLMLTQLHIFRFLRPCFCSFSKTSNNIGTYNEEFLLILFCFLIVNLQFLENSNAANVLIENFENAKIDDWLIFDELDKNLSWKGPSDWSLKKEGIEGIGLYQGANLWGDPTDCSYWLGYYLFQAKMVRLYSRS